MIKRQAHAPKPARHLPLHHDPHAETTVKYPSNRISTARYFWYNGLPKLLWEELSKPSNFYFVIVVALQIWKCTSSTSQVPTTAPVLAMVITFVIVLKLVEDHQRHVADRIANTSACHRLVDGAIVDSVWTDVRVGDVLLVRNREPLPADLLLIAAHEPDPAAPRGACHVETKQLDGETNLKGRSVPSQLVSRLGPGPPERQLAAWLKLAGEVESEPPNAKTNAYSGLLKLDGAAPVPLSLDNVLMRGSTLRNSPYVLGLVLTTGKDTKVMQGARKPKTKESSLVRAISWMMLAIFLILVALCLLAAGGTSASYAANDFANAWYFEVPPAPGSAAAECGEGFLVQALAFFALLASFVSITLNASIVFVQKMLGKFLEWSLELYDPLSDSPCVARSASLVDELGCITHIFSDKTGTLTQNVMQFRKASIGGVSYGTGTTEIGLARMRRLGQPLPVTAADSGGKSSSGDVGSASNGGGSSDGGGAAVVDFEDPRLFAALRGESGQAQAARVHDFFQTLSLCHSVVVEHVHGAAKLSASSPDEMALVGAAAFFGYDFVDRIHGKVRVRMPTARDEAPHAEFEALELLEFTSARMRMSVVVRDAATAEIALLSKGADTAMLKRLAPGQDALVAATEAHMIEHADDGLRTLVICKRTLAEDEYAKWAARYAAACAKLAEVEKQARGEANEIDVLCDELERGLTLLGSTAIEDKLQDGVPSTIADLARGGVALWVLTGDKQETAINIAFACQLINSETQLHIVSGGGGGDNAASAVRTALFSARQAVTTAAARRKAIVIDGEAIDIILRAATAAAANPAAAAAPHAGMEPAQDPEMLLALLQVTLECDAVVACRCAPAQKAQLVRLVRKNLTRATTLAIGDGANDVAMIQAAHVGVGISGVEGMQAANSADFAIAQFRFLRDLMLVHGRNAYRRLAVLVYYIFYKNIMMVLTIYWFNVYSGWSGTKLSLEVGYQMYNALFTAFPIVWISLVDKDVVDDLSRRIPQLYHLGIRRAYFGGWPTLRWIFEAVYESLFITFGTVWGLEHLALNGESPGLYLVGATTFTLAVIVPNLKLLLWSWQTSRWQALFILLELVLWYVCCVISSAIGTSSATPSFVRSMVIGWYGLWENIQATGAFWLLLVLLTTATLLPQLFYIAAERAWRPELRDLAMEAAYYKRPMEVIEDYVLPRSATLRKLVKGAPVLPSKTKTLWERLRVC